MIKRLNRPDLVTAPVGMFNFVYLAGYDDSF